MNLLDPYTHRSPYKIEATCDLHSEVTMTKIPYNKTNKTFWMTLLLLGCVDLLRGFMHTVMLEYAAANIAGITDADAFSYCAPSAFSTI